MYFRLALKISHGNLSKFFLPWFSQLWKVWQLVDAPGTIAAAVATALLGHSYLFGVGGRDASFPIIRPPVKVRNQILQELLEFCCIVIVYNNRTFKACQSCHLPWLISNKIKTRLSWLSFSTLVLSQDCSPNDSCTPSSRLSPYFSAPISFVPWSHWVDYSYYMLPNQTATSRCCWPWGQNWIPWSFSASTLATLVEEKACLELIAPSLPFLHACGLSARLE